LRTSSTSKSSRATLTFANIKRKERRCLVDSSDFHRNIPQLPNGGRAGRVSQAETVDKWRLASDPNLGASKSVTTQPNMVQEKSLVRATVDTGTAQMDRVACDAADIESIGGAGSPLLERYFVRVHQPIGTAR